LICAHPIIWQDGQLDDGGRYAVEVEVDFFIRKYVKLKENRTVAALILRSAFQRVSLE